MSWYRYQNGQLILTLHVQPGAKKNAVAGLHGEALKIRLAAPPIEGRANQALIKFIAELLAVSMRDVTLRQGEQSRHKVVAIENCELNPEALLLAD